MSAASPKVDCAQAAREKGFRGEARFTNRAAKVRADCFRRRHLEKRIHEPGGRCLRGSSKPCKEGSKRGKLVVEMGMISWRKLQTSPKGVRLWAKEPCDDGLSGKPQFRLLGEKRGPGPMSETAGQGTRKEKVTGGLVRQFGRGSRARANLSETQGTQQWASP